MTIAIPTVGPARPLRLPNVVDETLPNGLRIVAVRRPSVPRVEIRLRLQAGLARDAGNGVTARVFPETLLGGTQEHDSVGIARELQRLGASLDAGSDADDLFVSGGTLAGSLDGLLSLMADVVMHATFPEEEVAIARDRVAQEIIIQRSQPQALAAEALSKRLFPKHPYGRGFASPKAVRSTRRDALVAFRKAAITPRGSTILLVGDLKPAKIVEQVAAAFGVWRAKVKPLAVPALTERKPNRSILVINRPGAVQTNIRMGGSALPRTHPDHMKLALAVMVFGGYFTSRLVSNIREDKGYTYGGGAMMSQRRAGASLTVGADVRADVTAAALMEIRYELARMTSLPVTTDELDAARRYMAGIAALSVQTQSGLTRTLDPLLATGLGAEYLTTYRTALDRVTVGDVLDAARGSLGIPMLDVVMVGDAEQIVPRLEAQDPVIVSG